MNQSLLALGAGLLLALPSPALSAQAAGTVSLSGHVLPIVKQLPPRGHLSATNLNLTIGLPLRNLEDLTNLLAQITDPASTNYHKYLTPEQFTEKFGPSDEDYQAVAEFARQHRLSVTTTHGNRMLLDVRGLSTDIEQAFHVNLQTYPYPNGTRQFFATDVEPSVPAGLKIQDISGLNNFDRAHARLAYLPASAKASLGAKGTNGASPRIGSGPFGLYIGNDFRNAYIPGSSLGGSGQNVALVEFDGFLASDINEYESLAGRTNIPLTTILLNGFNGQPTGNGNEVEVSGDIQMLVSMAPALAQILVYEEPFGDPPNDILNRIATDDSASQVGCSWGWSGGPSATTDQIFQQMALQGQTIFVASGDSDAYPAGTVDNALGQGAPADSAYVTSVGGTTLTMDPTATTRISETVWNWDVEYGTLFDGIGSSGGISTYYKIPSWQTNVNMTACQGSTTNRNFPDVALTADNILVIADGGVEYLGFGTSTATPLWAGFTAMINQQEAVLSHAAIGFINPALYAIANSTNYTNCFFDIATGNNTWSGSPSLFFAVTNYDLCTGLGTPKGTNLINALVTSPVTTNYVFKISAPPAPYGTTLSAMNGGTPNGAWNLFIQDDYQFNSGMISNGWAINITLGAPLGSVADLGLALNASATAVPLGSNVVFYYSVTNYGGFSTATNVFVANSLTSGTTFISSTPSPGTTFQRSGDQFIWTIGNLATNAGATLSVTVQAPTVAGNIVASALAQSATPNPNPDDAQQFVSVAVGTTGPTLSGSYNNGHFILNVGGTTGTFIIEESTNLAKASAWVPVITNTAPFSYTNYNSLTNRQLFYEAVTLP
jgi:uncharacterized repeat protein (TIGR01451 family)